MSSLSFSIFTVSLLLPIARSGNVQGKNNLYYSCVSKAIDNMQKEKITANYNDIKDLCFFASKESEY